MSSRLGPFKLAAKRWAADGIPRYSAALAYYTLFSLAPLLVIAIALAGMAFGRDAAEGRVMQELEGLIGPSSALAVQSMIRSAWKPRQGLFSALAGAATLVLGASGVFNELRGALNAIWKVPPKGGGFFKLLLNQTLSIAFLLGVGFLLLVSLLFSAALAALGSFLGGLLPIPEPLLHLAGLAFEFAATWLLFCAIFHWMPDSRPAWRELWGGAALTTLLFIVGKFLLGLYLGKSALMSTYGAAASVAVLLVWVYYSAYIFYFGAEYVRAKRELESDKIVT